jgi:hypothetical protein
MGKYTDLAEKIGKLVDEKNAAYGSSFDQAGDFLKLLYPDGIPVDSYTDMLCVVRIFDKLKRIATRKDAFGESPYGDIVGYGLLGLYKDGGSQKVENTEPEPSVMPEPSAPTPVDANKAKEQPVKEKPQVQEKITTPVQKAIEHVGVKKEIAPAVSVAVSVAEPPAGKKAEAAPVKKPNCALCGLEVEGTIPEEELKAGKTIVHNDCYSKYLREQKAKAST